MSEKLIVLVTGANGYVAGQTIAALLSAGYAVRGTVRSTNSAKALVDAFSSYGDALEIVQVPDIVAPGAFDEVVKGTFSRLLHTSCKLTLSKASMPLRISQHPSASTSPIPSLSSKLPFKAQRESSNLLSRSPPSRASFSCPLSLRF